jgi:hypothetical protein
MRSTRSGLQPPLHAYAQTKDTGRDSAGAVEIQVWAVTSLGAP